MHIRAFCFAVPLLALIFATCNSGTSDSRPGKVTARASEQSAPPLVYTCLITRDVKGLKEFYERVYRECRIINSQTFPPARAVQELVQAWKQLRKWRR